MSLHPVVPAAVLLLIAAVVVATRAIVLSAVLARTDSSNRRSALLRWSASTAAVLLLVLAAARPAVDSPGSRQPDRDLTATSQGANVNVFFLIDRSVDSRVADYGERTSRMTGIRTDIAAVIDAYPKARFAMIGFASRPSVDWPLSEDTWSLKAVVAGLSPYVSVPPDAAYRADAAAAANVLRYQLIQAAQQYPGAQNLVFYLGAGAGGSTAPQDSFSVGGRVAGGAVFGYGTPAGGPIPGAYVGGAVTYLADPRSGAPAISAINEPGLRRLAGDLGVPYVHRESGVPLTGLPAPRPGAGAEAAVLTSAPLPRRVELYWVLALLAAALLLPEIHLLVREFRRDRMVRR